MPHDLLLEIGTEEIPARFMPAAIAAMNESAERLFKENRVQFRDIVVYATPRRLVLIVEGLEKVQGDITTEILGPPRCRHTIKMGCQRRRQPDSPGDRVWMSPP